MTQFLISVCCNEGGGSNDSLTTVKLGPWLSNEITLPTPPRETRLQMNIRGNGSNELR